MTELVDVLFVETIEETLENQLGFGGALGLGLRLEVVVEGARNEDYLRWTVGLVVDRALAV